MSFLVFHPFTVTIAVLVSQHTTPANLQSSAVLKFEYEPSFCINFLLKNPVPLPFLQNEITRLALPERGDHNPLFKFNPFIE
jgi:hypothetical protein